MNDMNAIRQNSREALNNKSKDYIYIFIHIPKCAGSSINSHISSRYSQNERLRLNHKTFGINIEKSSKMSKERVAHLVKSMSANQRDSIRIINGHLAYFGIHELFSNKIPRYFTFIRNPVTRTISHYNFFRSESPARQKFCKVMKNDGGIVPFEEWLETAVHASNYMVRFCSQSYAGENLHDLDFIVNKEHLEQTKNLLNKLWFVGLTESRSDMEFIYNRLGVNFYISNKNISKKYFQPQDYEKTKSLVLSKNQLDMKLYNYAIDLNQNMISNINDYNMAVLYTKSVRDISAFAQKLKRTTKAWFNR